MDFGLATFVLAYVAGVLSTLSPCVLPLLPIVLASAAARHPLGPLALGIGLTASFVCVGLAVATTGFALGGAALREAAAAVLVLLGAVLAVPPLQRRVAAAGSRLASAGGGYAARLSGEGWGGQLAIGLLLGVVWTPCVGPTLGAASALAAGGGDLPRIGAVMLVFGLGAATPLVVLGGLSHGVLGRWRSGLRAAGRGGGRLLGIALLLIGIAILTGFDRRVEAWAVDHAPDWLTRLTTRY